MGNPTPPPSTQIATIPDLPLAGALNGAELIWINQAGLDRSAAVSAVAALGGAGVYLPLTGGNLSGSLSVSGSLTVGGSASGTTPTAGDNSAAFATTAFVQNAILGVSGVSSFNGRNGAVTLTQADVTGVGGATAAQLANYLPLAGGAISGALSVGGGLTATTRAPGDSTTNVATTAFVAGALPLASTTTPLVNGTAAVGVGTTWARADHVHPTDTSRAAASALAGYLPLSGGTLTGPLALTPTTAGQATITLNDAAGNARQINFQTAGNQRWAINAGSVAESGSNAGSNFNIQSYNDAGTLLATPLSINRATGAATLTGSVTLSGPAGQQLFLNGNAGTFRSLVFETAGSPRWSIAANNGTESGGQNGSDFIITRQSDTGAYIDTPFMINRVNKTVALNTNIVNVNADAGTDAALALVKNGSGHNSILYGYNGANARWYLQMGNSAAETGSNAGSDLVFGSFNDSGTWIDNPLIITRSNSVATFSGNILCMSGNILSRTAALPSVGVYNTSGYCVAMWVDNSPHFYLGQANGAGTPTGPAMCSWDWSGNMNNTGPTAYKPGGGSWTATSDARIKTVSSQYVRGLEHVLQLNPIVYRYKGNDGEPEPDDGKALEERDHVPLVGHRGVTDRDFIGLVAQDVEATFPEMVTLASGWIDGKRVDDLRQLDTTPLIFALVNAVKTLAAEVEALKAAQAAP